MKTKIQRPVKNDCDKQIETRSRSQALDFVAAAAQILTIMCIVKGNPAWKGSLSLLFFGGAAALVYKYDEHKEKTYFIIGIVLGIIGTALLIWFGITGSKGCLLHRECETFSVK